MISFTAQWASRTSRRDELEDESSAARLSGRAARREGARSKRRFRLSNLLAHSRGLLGHSLNLDILSSYKTLINGVAHDYRAGALEQ